MDVEVDYDGSKMNLSFPAQVVVEQYRPAKADCPFTYEDYKDLFYRHEGGEYLKSNAPLFVVNDVHRNTPTALILSWFNKIDSSLLKRAKFLIATGTHKPPDTIQHKKIFGDLFEQIKGNISVHDTYDLSGMKKIGQDQFGEDVFLNSLLFEHDKIIVINSVEPHYFAGYSGGRKSFFPGLTDFKTIERNHNLANSLESQPTRLSGNPMAEHLENLTSLFDTSNIFSVQIVFDADKKIAGITMGDLKKSFIDGIKIAEKYCIQTTTKKYDCIFSVLSPPLDRSLYQIQKGVENVRTVLNKNGSVVLISACNDGIGSDKFYKLSDEWDKEKNCHKSGLVKFGSHKLSRVNAMSKEYFVGIFSKLEETIVEHVFYKAVSNLGEFIEQNIKPAMRVAIVHDSGNVVFKYKH
ncbi:MAG: lactate racemase domain-containing protein [candidate division Zixibacteria bacterium]|nr:lactate racemase domain-containing protein [candidate division Zixibacteria bacterium]